MSNSPGARHSQPPAKPLHPARRAARAHFSARSRFTGRENPPATAATRCHSGSRTRSHPAPPADHAPPAAQPGYDATRPSPPRSPGAAAPTDITQIRVTTRHTLMTRTSGQAATGLRGPGTADRHPWASGRSSRWHSPVARCPSSCPDTTRIVIKSLRSSPRATRPASLLMNSKRSSVTGHKGHTRRVTSALSHPIESIVVFNLPIKAGGEDGIITGKPALNF